MHRALSVHYRVLCVAFWHLFAKFSPLPGVLTSRFRKSFWGSPEVVFVARGLKYKKRFTLGSNLASCLFLDVRPPKVRANMFEMNPNTSQTASRDRNEKSLRVGHSPAQPKQHACIGVEDNPWFMQRRDQLKGGDTHGLHGI